MILRHACYNALFDNPGAKDRFPDGMTAADILGEIRRVHGKDAFPYVSILDVCDTMNELKADGFFND